MHGGEAQNYSPHIMEASRTERRWLNQVKDELAQTLKRSGTREKGLETAGLKPSTYDTAWGRHSMRLLWILRILEAHEEDPTDFFRRAFRRETVEDEPPELLIARERRAQLLDEDLGS